MAAAPDRISAAIDDQTMTALRHIARQEARSLSSCIVLLVRLEAERRGFVGRAPQTMAAP